MKKTFYDLPYEKYIGGRMVQQSQIIEKEIDINGLIDIIYVSRYLFCIIDFHIKKKLQSELLS